MRVLYFGMLGEFSRAPLAALLEAGAGVCGVVVAVDADRAPITRLEPDASRSELPILGAYLEHNIVHIGWERGLPVFQVGRLAHTDTLAIMSSLRPDVACVACFPRRIPAALLALPKHGFLNLHPSLLPLYRGPEPLFWFLRAGGGSTGVTLHFMDERLDTGDIAAQAPIDLPNGVSRAEAERLCAALGGQLMVEVVQALERGTLARRSQPEGGTYYPAPTPDDFSIDTSWPARRAFNFMRGTADWRQPYTVETGAERLRLDVALAFSPDERLERPYLRFGDTLRIQFTPGVLEARER
ncbi:MAG TPA: formyltransferase family protein [Anaerolineae bacterium]|nr:formyltransferase family protein [Anaerolineae bacterium]